MTSLTEILVNLPLAAAILLKVTIVLGISWFLHFLMAKRNPHWRLVSWRCAITCLLLIPLLVPFSYLRISIPARLERSVISPSETAFENSISEAAFILEAEPVDISQRATLKISQPSFSLIQWLRAKIWIIVLVGWGSVAIILFLRFLAGFLQVRQKVLSSVQVPEHLQQLLDRVAEDIGSRNKVTLRYASDMSTPFLTGLLNPIIIIPERMTGEQYENRMTAIFAHEVAHHKSYDHIWTLVIRWLEVIFWFHPLIWDFRNAHSLACEEVCDAVAAEYIGNTESYASTLANLALEIVGKVNIAGGIPMARSSEILERLRTLKQQLYPHSPSRGWLFLSAMVTTIVLGVLGGISLVYAEPAGRVLHFPEDRSLGRITVLDVNYNRQIRDYMYWDDGGWNGNSEYLGQAQGVVVIPAGKIVALTVNKNAVNDLSPLLKLKSDDLDMLSLRTLPARNKCMTYVAHLTGLKELDLYGTNITDAGVKLIPKLQSLDCLTLPNSITNSGLYNIAPLPSLKRLYLIESNVTDKGLYQISKMKSLEELSLAGEEINGTGFVHLTKLPRLHYLLLSERSFGDTGMEHLRNIPSLKTLTCYDTNISDAGLQQLSGHGGLENLCILRAGLTDRGLGYLKTMPSLKKLCIYKESGVTDNGMAHLAHVESLVSLDLPDITDKGMPSIAKLKNLKHLHIYGGSYSKVTDAALRHLSALQSLEVLLISGRSCTNAGMDYLARLTNLRELYISADSVTDEGLAKLKTLKSLEKLSFGSKNVTVSGLSHLNAFKNLTDLNVSGIWQDDSGMDISALTALEKLTLKFKMPLKKEDSHDPVVDEDLECLKNLKNLKWFQVAYPQHSRITDTGVSYLKDLTNMERLGVGSPYLTDTSLSCLTNMKKLNHLNVTGNFTDNGLGDLEDLKGLQHVWINTSEDFSPTALEHLQNALPNIYTFTVKQNIDIK